MKYLLALDGGGIRGVLTATILARIETMLGKPAAKVFDLIAGTSTGGIMACGLATGMSAQALAALYATRGSEIFSRSPEWKAETLHGIMGPKYPDAPIEAILKEILGDKTLADCQTAIVVPTYAIEAPIVNKAASYFFKSWVGPNCYLRDVARATSAAETYFPPYQFTNLEGQIGAFTDGGTFCNSPGLAALADASDLWPKEPKILLAIGTGQLEKDIPYDKAKTWGLASWGLNIIDVFMDGQADVVDHWLSRWPGLKYVRVQVALPPENASMDNVAPANIAALEALGNGVDIAKAVALLKGD